MSRSHDLAAVVRNGQSPVARTSVAPDVEVHTVFLGLDHQGLRPGPAILFASRVIGGPLDGTSVRYAAWDEAEQGHLALVTHVQAAQAIAALPPGHLCDVCLDAPAVALQPAPWGGEMGVCEASQGRDA